MFFRLVIVFGLSLLSCHALASSAGQKMWLLDLLESAITPPLDSDGDGSSDSADPDDDNDGMPDVYEISMGFNPLDPSDGLEDADRDGATNAQEYIAASDPFDFFDCAGSACSFDPAPLPNQISVPAADPVSDSVGAIAGGLNISPGGNASYSIPLLVPTGVGGLQPQVSLFYSSSAGNGLAGLGWGASGTSVISRCPQTLEQDGARNDVSLDQHDRFCLDGQRLVLGNPSHTYGANGVEYRTEIDSNTKIVSYGQLSGGPEYFRVWSEDGSVSDYGFVANSRVQPTGGAVLMWAKSRTRDAYSFATNGNNRIEYTYNGWGSTKDFRLLTIKYAFSSSGAARATVEFNYEARPDNSYSAVAGVLFEQKYRLNDIVVKEESMVLRTYNLTYLNEINSNDKYPSKLASLSECRGSVCLPPTQFTWSTATGGFSFASTSTPVTGFSGYIEPVPSNNPTELEISSSITANVNGDAYRDLIWMEETSEEFSFRVGLSNGATLNTDSYESVLFGKIYGWTVTDYDQDGFADILLVSDDDGAEVLSLFLNQDLGAGVRGYTVNPIVLISDLALASESSKVDFTDANSDGLLDITYDMKVRYAEADSLEENGPFKLGSESTYASLSAINATISSLYSSSSFRDDLKAHTNKRNYYFKPFEVEELRLGADFTGDGLPDILATMHDEYCQSSNPCTGERDAAKVILKNNGAGGFSLYDYLIIFNDSESERISDCRPVDLNRDGLVDLLCDAGKFSFNDGKQMSSAVYNSSIDGKVLHSLIDYNQDGYLDFVYKSNANYDLRVLLWSENKFANSSSVIAQTNYIELYGPAGSFFDINGDGLDDYVNFNTGVYLGKTAAVSGNPTKAYNLITKIKDGLGNEKHIEYKPLTDDSIYTRESDAVEQEWGAAVFDYIAPRYVVSRVRNKTPAYDGSAFNANAESAMSYTYAGMKVQPAGRGMLGFRLQTILDEQTGMVTENTYLQQFPFTGLLAESNTYVPGSSTALSEATMTYAKLNNLNGPNAAPFRAVMTQSIVTTRAAESVASSDAVTVAGVLSTVTSEFDNYNTYGGFGTSTVTTTGDGSTYQTVTANSFNHDATKWHINRLVTTQTTTTQSGKPTVVRQAAFTYDSATGLVASEVQEPNNSLYSVTTTYLRDSFGNRIRATETAGSLSRYTRVVYDATGRYINQVYNNLEQLEMSVISRNIYGSATVTQNMDGVRTYTGYGALGRQYFEGNDSGSFSKSEYRLCGSGVTCPTGAVYRQRSTAADGSESFSYFDNLSRAVRQQVKGFDGTLVTTDAVYDESGRVKLTSNPYKPSESIVWTTNDYDVVGRLRKTTDPDGNIATNSYDLYSAGGMTGTQIVATNAESQTKTTISDARGLPYLVTDDLGGRIGYEYDARGNLTKLISKGTTSQPLNIETVIGYDLLGRRISLDDPDQGEWAYEYNRFNELVEQEDALGQRTEMSYDALGRMLTRVDKKAGGTVEGSTTWTYDTANNGLGKVSTVSDSISGYVAAYDYDDLGRVSRTFTALGINSIDGEYSQIVTYDQIGRVFQEVDATFHGIQYAYNSHGYIEKVLEATNTSKVYHKIEHTDAWGNVTQSKLGNGLKVQRTYHAATGLPERVLVSNPLLETIQDNTYDYNAIGILTNRSRFIEANDSTLSETFHYDELNRLTQASA
ncbi:MAG: SpvB/TcaC N-terminal domain-containing protein, partial [Gammaproteobacteria bacterium]|nr:SpvB/TcaC N-terminal domain-containing protein [Gammaproteobacteria bacterium]